MQLLQLTLETPAENLALDDALLDEAEQCGRPREMLRLWESPQPLVVLGRSSRIADEVYVDRCLARDISIVRRGSGGGVVMAGPGCLMYALVLSYELRPRLRLIDEAHHFVLSNMQAALRRVGREVRLSGISDLAVKNRKVAGASMRCKRTHLLYHGALLVDFPLSLIEDCLPPPPREPAYRARRKHEQFLANLHVSREELTQAIIDQWRPANDAANTNWPQDTTRRLAAEKYGQEEWTWRH